MNAVHKRDAPNVEQEHGEADAALDEVEHDGIIRISRREVRRPRRDDDEEHACKHERKADRHGELLLRHLLVLLARRLCRKRERAHPDDEGLDHDDRAADERQIEDWIAVADGRDGMRLDLDLAGRQSHRRRRPIRIAHHDALDDCLPADGKISNSF